MKPSGKKVTLSEMTGDLSGAMRDIFVTQPKAWFARFTERLNDLPKTNFELAQRFAEEGRWNDAIFRFRVLQYLKPDYPGLMYNLGCCYFGAGKMKEAEAAMREALKQDPSNANARFILASVNPAALSPDQRPQRMPKEMITGFFAPAAASYDIEESTVKYQGGKVIHDLVKPLVAAPAPRVLDLGSGTGIAARPWRQIAAGIAGVDITRTMVAMADKAVHADKKLFDVLYEADVHELPPQVPSADVILVVNVAPYIGNLSALVQQISAKLIPQGVAVITLEAHAGGAEGFGVSADTGRFGHSAAYVRGLAQNAGLKVLQEARVELYAGQPVDAIVLGKM